ncbi:MAG TPA: hypothetical protein VNE18_02065 [Rhodanobacter sp.]|nr:hypothetical protein [Rhodanobacter sp.]
MKRYALWECRLVKVGAYLVSAPMHRAAHAARHHNWQGIARCVLDTAWPRRNGHASSEAPLSPVLFLVS